MARLGRLDVYFSTRGDQELWDVISQNEEGDKGYWLKHYAKLGLLAAQSGFVPTGIPASGKDTQTPQKKSLKSSKPKEKRKTNPTPPKEPTEENTSTELDNLSLSIKKLDPAEKRKQAMANLISADPRLISALDDEKEDS